MTGADAKDNVQPVEDLVDLDDLQEWGKADPGAKDAVDRVASRRPHKTRRWRKWWAGSLIGLVLIQQGLGILVRTIPLGPDNNVLIDRVALIVAAVATAGWIFGNRNFFGLSPFWRWFVAFLTGIPFGAAVCIFALLAMAQIIQVFDFPPGRTHQSIRLFSIDRYESDTRTVGFTARNQRVGISEADSKRLEAALRARPDASYCLRAVAQQHGKAVRIMHAEGEDFPTGSIVGCGK